MKSTLFSLLFVALFMSSAAQAFISSGEQKELLAAMNKINPSQVAFEDIRCSLRSRMCLVKSELGPQKIKVGCAIERINGSADLFVETSQGLQLSPYSREALEQCLAGFQR